MPGAPLHVLYDRDCGFCRTTLAMLLALDDRGRLLPTSIQGEQGLSLLGSVPAGRRLETAHVVGPDGVVHSGGDAAAQLAAEVPALAPFAPLLRRFAGASRAGYGLVARNRTRLGPLIPERAKWRAGRAIDEHRRRHFGLAPEA
jgi:predicted DCC family thiol-disulfide oxidoreductase YuxK